MENNRHDESATQMTRRTWNTPRVILSELSETQKFPNTLESPPTAFGGGGFLTNQGPS